MTIIKNSVLLLKTQKDNDSIDLYEELLLKNKLKVSKVKTLVFNFYNIQDLADKLANTDNYAGIILSSPRCVEAVHLACGEQNKLNDKWVKKNNYCVGEATFNDASSKLGILCEGKDTGNAKNLAKFIIESMANLDKSKPFLFPHGNLKTDTLKYEFEKANIKMEEVQVYDTIANPDIQNDLSDVTEQFKTIPEYVVFFSPSGLHSSISFIRKIPVDLDFVKFVAIGPVTETALIVENLKVYSVAKSPTPEDVLKAILS